jgi:hypothetical protein
MNGECVRVEHMADLDLLAADDPRRLHVERCPRCRSLYAAYRAFMTPEPPPSDSDAEDARAHLAAALEREMSATGGKVAGSIPRRGAVRWAGWAAAAAIVAVSALVWVRQGPLRPPEAPVMRGPAAATTLVLASPARVDAGVELSWTAEPAAIAYDVVLYDDAMREVLRLPSHVTRVVLTRAMLGERVPPGTDLAWRVIAKDASAEVGRSSVGTFEAP